MRWTFGKPHTLKDNCKEDFVYLVEIMDQMRDRVNKAMNLQVYKIPGISRPYKF
jgi:hypothetical protein